MQILILLIVSRRRATSSEERISLVPATGPTAVLRRVVCCTPICMCTRSNEDR